MYPETSLDLNSGKKSKCIAEGGEEIYLFKA